MFLRPFFPFTCIVWLFFHLSQVLVICHCTTEIHLKGQSGGSWTQASSYSGKNEPITMTLNLLAEECLSPIHQSVPPAAVPWFVLPWHVLFLAWNTLCNGERQPKFVMGHLHVVGTQPLMNLPRMIFTCLWGGLE